MSTGMYRDREALLERPYYDEREYFMTDRFYPGELGAVIVLAIASLLLWSAACYGLTTDPHAKAAPQNQTAAY